MNTTAPTGARQAAPVTAGPPTMRAIVQDSYGSADVLRLANTVTPAIAPSEVLVQVRAAGVDRGTWHLMAGQPYLMRILGFGLRRPKNPDPGLEWRAPSSRPGPR